MCGTGEVSDNFDSNGIPIIIGYNGISPVYIHNDLRDFLLKLLEKSKK